MRNSTFVPLELTVLPGTGITWVNDDDKVHAVKTIGTYAGKFNSGDILPGAIWSYTFGKQEGSFEFTCSYHPEMKGTIIIKKAETSLVRTPAI
jgi:plastocyanin